jgi:hypothetical protein
MEKSVRYELYSDTNDGYCLLVKTDLGWKEFNTYTKELEDVSFDFVTLRPSTIFDLFCVFMGAKPEKIISVVEHGELQF